MSTVTSHDGFTFTPEMKKALMFSVLMHVGIIAFGIVGLPYVTKPPHIPQPIAIEVIDISELDTAIKPPNNNKLKKVQEKPQPKAKKTIEAPPKVEAKAPPKIKPIEKPVVKKEPVKVEKVKPEPVPEPVKKAEVKKPEPVKEKPKPKEPEVNKIKVKKAEPKVEPKPEPVKEKSVKKVEPEVSQEDEFLSVLKNLQDASTPSEAVDNAVKPTPAQASPLAKFSQKLSATEVSAIAAALNQQFSQCWNLMAGARNAEDIIVKINLKVRPDRTVQSANIVEKMRYNQDSFYRAAADEAMRAVRHPNCEVLDLPPDKYELWKDLIFNFNPSAQL